MPAREIAHVTPTEIARLAGVTSAAVSNWRRRYADFPQPAAGTSAAPLFALHDVEGWLEQTGKGREVSDEVRLWQSLRLQFGERMVSGVAAVARQLVGEESNLEDAAAVLTDDLGSRHGADTVVNGLVARYVASVGRGEAEAVSTPLLVRVMSRLASECSGTVYDPACGIGDLLLTVGNPGFEIRIGQDIDAASLDLLECRASLSGRPATVAPGDSLRTNAFPDLKADLVVCDPPRSLTDWGREELLLDSRWEFGIPPKSEGELAWLQHCLACTAPGGKVLMALPATVAYRRSGRRIRSGLIRAGHIDTIAQLPTGSVAGSSVPAHLWVLRRTPSGEDIRMVDLSSIGTAADLESAMAKSVAVPQISILDEEVDLSPLRYLDCGSGDVASAYNETSSEFERLARELIGSLPDLMESQGWDRSVMLNISDLVRNDLVSVAGDTVTSNTDQLDSDFLRGIVRSSANARRNTSSSGTLRLDPRGAKVPQLDPATQQQYGAAFRATIAFERSMDELAQLGAKLARLAREGLTNGVLKPMDKEAK
ncbi:N-6 DNA methylase [Nocardia sp. NPDC049220]|uniref:HsdM family class I SAM-dependent methyltransferase n=1 Tax=Nocardia sp. NPDC049220 TaxID=3155273 RepID=UPI0033D384CC